MGLAGGIDPERNSDGKVSVSDPQGKIRATGEPPRPGDFIFVPRSNLVSVQGAVFAPGSFPFRAGLPVWYYVGLAGGIDPDRNDNRKVTVSDSQGKLRSAVEPLRPGDFIIVPNSSFLYNLNRYAPLVGVIATIIATTVTVLSFLQLQELQRAQQ